jgi:hypothetical protein
MAIACAAPHSCLPAVMLHASRCVMPSNMLAVPCAELCTACITYRVAFHTEPHVSPPAQLRLDRNVRPESAYTPWLQGLPTMGFDHSPTSSQWTNSIAFCTIMKDENITDIREWLTYHRCAS